MARRSKKIDKPVGIPEGFSLLATLAGHTGDVKALAVTPDGRSVVSGSNDMNSAPGHGVDSATAVRRRWNCRGGKAMSRKRYESGSGNVFKDIGLPNAEEHFVKAQLVFKIDTIMKKRALKQVDAARLF